MLLNPTHASPPSEIVSQIEENLASIQQLLTQIDFAKQTPSLSPKLQKIETALVKIHNAGKENSSLFEAAQKCQEVITSTKKTIEGLASKPRSAPTYGQQLKRNALLRAAHSFLHISTEEEEKFSTKINELENRLISRKKTVSFCHSLSFAMTEYFVYNITKINAVPPEQRPSFLSRLFTDYTSPTPSPTPLGTLFTTLLNDHPDFVENVLYVNLLNMAVNAYESLDRLQEEHPFLLFELLHKGLEAAHIHTQEGTWTQSKEFPAFRAQAAGEKFSLTTAQIILPLLFPKGSENLIIPDIFMNFFGKEAIGSWISERVKRAFATKVPAALGKGVEKISKSERMRMALLVKIYNKLIKALDKIDEKQSDETLGTPLSKNAASKEETKYLPKETRQACVNALSQCLKDVSTGHDRTSVLLHSFSTPLAKKIVRMVEGALSDTSPSDGAEEVLSLVVESIASALRRRAQPRQRSAHDRQKLESVQNAFHSKMTALLKNIWKQKKPGLSQEGDASDQKIKDKIKEGGKNVAKAVRNIGLRFLCAVMGAKKFVKQKTIDAETIFDSISIDSIFSIISDFVMDIEKEYPITPEGHVS